jgi:hypothetical protein
VPVALYPTGDGGELLGNMGRAGRKHDDWARTCFAHVPEKVLIDFLYLGQFIVNRGCNAEIVQVPKQLFPTRVAPKLNVFGSAG